MNQLISVIVPIHNAEKYLHQCLQSIVGQTYQKLEIILVDDCSTDTSAAICDEYAAEDDRIRVIHKTSPGGEGGAIARNEGIEAATGDVYYFMDSDDYIEADMLENMLTIMNSEESECVISSFHYVDDKGEELPWYVPELSGYQCMSGKEAAKIFLTTKDIEGFSWNKLLDKRLIEEEKIRFDESVNSFVDMHAMFKAVSRSKKVSFYPRRAYFYRQLNTSCVHTMTVRKIRNFDKALSGIKAEAKTLEITSEADVFFRYRMCMQLHDAVKAKKNYSAADWNTIQQEFSWDKCIGIPLGRFINELNLCNSEKSFKTKIKVLLVYLNFSK